MSCWGLEGQGQCVKVSGRAVVGQDLSQGLPSPNALLWLLRLPCITLLQMLGAPLFFLSFFFWCGPFLKSLMNLLQYLCLFFWPGGMWDLSCLTKDWTRTACIRRWSLNRWTAREVPGPLILKQQFGSFPSKMLFTHMLAHIKAYLLLLCPVPWKVFCSWRGFMEKIIHKV